MTIAAMEGAQRAQGGLGELVGGGVVFPRRPCRRLPVLSS